MKRKYIKKLVCFIMACLCLVSNITGVGLLYLNADTVITASADGDPECTRWLSCKISQNDISQPSGCTGCSTLMILQNCRLLDAKYQFGEVGKPVTIKERTLSTKNSKGTTFLQFVQQVSTVGGASYTNTTEGAAGWHCWSWDYDGSGISANDLKKLTHDKLKPVNTDDKKLKVTGNAYASGCITGVGGKSFHDMSYSELAKALKPLWDAGFYMICSGGYTQNAGPSGFMAQHTSIIAGVTDKDVYVSDVTGAVISKVTPDWQDCLQFIIAYYSDETSPVGLLGGEVRTADDGKEDDGKPKAVVNKNADGSITLGGIKDEGELIEINSLIDKPVVVPNFTNLSADNKQAVRDWNKDLTDRKNEQFFSILRTIVAFIGILVVVYSVFLYVAYQFDCNQNFVDIELLSILSLGKLKVSPDNKQSTYQSTDNSEKSKHSTKVVVHKDIIIISIAGIALGIGLLSGKIYELISVIVKFIKEQFF